MSDVETLFRQGPRKVSEALPLKTIHLLESWIFHVGLSYCLLMSCSVVGTCPVGRASSLFVEIVVATFLENPNDVFGLKQDN